VYASGVPSVCTGWMGAFQAMPRVICGSASFFVCVAVLGTC
jgi:hypothetical protein